MQIKRKDVTIRPVHPNAGLRAAYNRKLMALIDAMHRSFTHWLIAQYRKTPPRLAQDATPAIELRRALRDLARQWDVRFDELAPKLARWFVRSAEARSSATLRRLLREGGMSVKFKMTPAMRDVLEATITEQVGLIKSIPQQYHTQIEGLVMRSVQTGRDLSTLSRQIEQRYGVTKRRAALIARDQNNKSTAVLVNVRQLELGITEAIWQHSGGGKEPRRTHVANSGKRYKIAEGWLDPDPKVKRRILPGELINCRCVSRSVVPGFS